LEISMTTETISEQNKKTVLAFYKEAHFDGDVDGAIARYVGDTYTQHTPAAPMTALRACAATSTAF
jgi:predicted SnoaL-like aldol condensation-catalyzing enzyme